MDAHNDEQMLEAIKVIEEGRMRRAEECRQAVARVLEEHGCVMLPVVQIAGDKLTASVLIQPK